MFNIICEDHPQIDTMPVLKTKVYPWAYGSYKPLMHARLAFSKSNGFFFDLMSFDRDPKVENGDILKDSCIASSFNFFPKSSKKCLTSVINSKGQSRIYVGDGSETAENPPENIGALDDLQIYGGSDEQGWYWGARFYVSDDLLKKIYQDEGSLELIEKGYIVDGGLYRFLSWSVNSHLSSVTEIYGDFIFDKKNYAEFKLI